MIYAITSKKKGCGRTGVALLTAMLTQQKTKGSTLLIDLGQFNEIKSLLDVKDSNASIDNLIANISLTDDESIYDRNIIETNGIYVIPGTVVKQARYLEKKYLQIMKVIQTLSTRFNTIILDVDYDLYEQLIDNDLSITPFQLLSQDMLNIEQYQTDINTYMFQGFYVLSRYNSAIVFPTLDTLVKQFPEGRLICVEEDVNLPSILNRKSLTVGSIKKLKSFNGLDVISTIMSKGVTITESSYGRPKKRSIFSLFSMRSVKPVEVNSIAYLCEPVKKGEK